MQYIFNVITGRIVVSSISEFLLKNEERYIKIDPTDPTETNKAAEARAVELGVELTKKPVDVWLEYIDYINTLTVINSDPLYNYIKDAGMELPDVIETEVTGGVEHSATVTEVTTTIAITDTVDGEPQVIATVVMGGNSQGISIDNQSATTTDSSVDTTVTSQPTAEAELDVFTIAEAPQTTIVPELEVCTDPVLLSGYGSYEEVLTVLAKTGYFIDNAEGELDKIPKDLYGFKHNQRFVVLSPKVVVSNGNDFILLKSIKLERRIIDGNPSIEPGYGPSFGVACGEPLVTSMGEDVVSLHNKLIQSVGYTGEGQLVNRLDAEGGQVVMAGHLVSLTKSL